MSALTKVSNQIITVTSFSGRYLATQDMTKMVHVIYNNFKDLQTPEIGKLLNHNKKEIKRVLTSPYSILIVALNQGSIISYLLADKVTINEEEIMHIYYLYTVPSFRQQGIATYMLNLIQELSIRIKIYKMTLTYDTYNGSLTRFYNNNGFQKDMELTTNGRFDMLVKII